MTLTINPDGSATYSVTVPAPIAVTLDAGVPGKSADIYHAGSAAVIRDRAKEDREGWAAHIAALIAVQDQAQLDDAAEQQTALDALAGALYTADITIAPEPAAEQPTFEDLPFFAATGYRKRAEVLDSLGVAIDDKGKGGLTND